MRIWKVGDKSKAICETCNDIKETTFGKHDLPFEELNGVARDVLAAACDDCGTVVAIPPQSTPQIKQALELMATD